MMWIGSVLKFHPVWNENLDLHNSLLVVCNFAFFVPRATFVFCVSWVSPAVSHSTRKFSWSSRSASAEQDQQHEPLRMLHQAPLCSNPTKQNIMDHWSWLLSTNQIIQLKAKSDKIESNQMNSNQINSIQSINPSINQSKAIFLTPLGPSESPMGFPTVDAM